MAKWIVFNQGEEMEFAECSNCGHEATPEMTQVFGYPREETRGMDVVSYPPVCPTCGRVIDEVVPAEEA